MLDAIVGKAMCKDRDARYQTWEAFARDLAEAVRSHQRLAPSAEFADTEKFDTLRALPFFTKFSDVEIWETLRFSQWQHVAPGTVIMHDGEAGDFFCFLAAGQLQVSKAGKALSILTQGEWFGEMAAINPQNPLRSADVAALGPVDIITVRGEALQQASEGCRMRFYESFLKVMATRLISANQREISF